MSPFRNLTGEPAGSPSLARTVRNRRAVWVLALFALLALVLWRPVRHYVLTAGVLRSDAPSEAVLTEVVEGASNPAPILERIWQTGSFSGRSFVVSHLLQRLNSDAALVRQMEALLEEAAFDADLEVREKALGILSQQNQPALRRWLHEQLSDADPAVRVLAVQQLARVANSNEVSRVMRLLNDPDLRVVAATGSFLRRVTGQDFGLRTTQALPTFTLKADAPVATVDRAGIERGREGWQSWWRAHQTEFPADNNPPTNERHIQSRPTPDFALEGLDGRRVRLSDFRGQAVLLTFWNLTNQLSVADEPVLQAMLREQPPGRLTVLAIAVNPAVWPEESCGDHGGGHGDEHGDAHEPAQSHCHKARMDLAGTRAAARALAARLAVRHPVLVDTTAALANRYAVNDLPAYVLLDAQGNLRRRVIGSRTEATFRAMVDEVAPTVSLPTPGRN